MTIRSGSHPDVTAFIENLPPSQRRIAETLRQIVVEVVPDSTESIKWGRPVFESNGLLCYVAPAMHHLSIGFYLGAYLNDPEGLLRGEGKQLRHLVIANGESVPEAVVRELISAAANLNRSSDTTQV
jgi:hypothetical protein